MMLEHVCELCLRTFYRPKTTKVPRFCSHVCRGLAMRAPGDYLERKREIHRKSASEYARKHKLKGATAAPSPSTRREAIKGV